MTTEHWIDQLLEKHECFTYRNTRTERLQVQARTIELVVPSWVPSFEVVRAGVLGDVLFLALRDLESRGWDRPLGAVAIGKQSGVDHYTTILWHSTYPHLLDLIAAPAATNDENR